MKLGTLAARVSPVALVAFLIALAWLYAVPLQAQSVSTDATLSALTVTPRDIIGFDSGRVNYEVGVDSTVVTATVTVTTNEPGATVEFDPPDADTGTDEYDVELLPGRNLVTVTVTAEDAVTTEDYTVSINRGVTDGKGWQAGADLDGLIAAGIDDLEGIWSDGTTVWVVWFNEKLIAYTLSDGTRDVTKDIDLVADNDDPTGIWSDGTTIWVADVTDTYIYAYTLSDGTRDDTKDIDLASGNINPQDIWSDGTTIWVSDESADKLFAYTLADGTRDAGKDIDVASDNGTPTGIWSDGTTVWVADWSADKIFAYTLSDGTRDAGKEFNTLTAAGNNNPLGIWSDGTTMWVVDDDDYKVYAYNMPASDDTTLSALTVMPRDIIGFDSGRTSYEVGVDSTVVTATVTVTTNEPGATVEFDPPDADTGTDEYDVELLPGRNLVTVTVTAEDAVTTQDYTVSINRGVTDNRGWRAGADLDGLIAAGNTDPRFIWSDGTTVWVTDSVADKIYAYTLSDGTRDDTKDIDLVADNDNPTGIWSDGTTIWVADWTDTYIYAYTLADGTRDDTKDIDLASGNDSPTGIWSDETTIWVVDIGDDKLFAYTLFDGTRDAGKEFDLAFDNADPRGIWSDGTTVWVADWSDDKLFAYTLSDGTRDAGKEFNTLTAAGNNNPLGIWSDETTMWVVDNDDDKVFAYNMVSSGDATLSALTVTPRDIIGFDSSRGNYEVGVDSTVVTATVTVTTNDDGATVEFDPPDADTGTDEYDVELLPGRNLVTVTVTAEDDVTTQDYTVSINRGVTDGKGWQAGADLDGLIAAGNGNTVGIWSDGTTMWVADVTDTYIYAYTLSDGTRDTGKEFDLASDNPFPEGIWSDGTTIWVSDESADKLFAYTLSDGSRDADKDIDLVFDNGGSRGIWSDGTTMWVVDLRDSYIYAYTLADGTRDAGKEFDLASDNADPRGTWSDGTTVWVADWSDDKLFAYTLSDGTRDAGKEFNTLAAVGNVFPAFIWSDETTMWVTDLEDSKVYAYNMPVDGPPDPSGQDEPVFTEGDSTRRSFVETYGDDDVTSATDIGGPVLATDDPGDTLTYTLAGTDVSKFDIVSTSGQLLTRAGEKYDHERQRTYEVTVVVEDNDGNTDTITVTLIVTDRDEPPLPPTSVNLSQTSGSASSLDVSWHPPDNPGRPDAVSYDLRYRQHGTANYTNGPQNVSGTRTAIGGLRPATSYQVQVRATNHEGDSDWTAAVTSTTAENSDPVRPSRPYGLVATGVSESRINLSWNAPFDDGGAPVTGYKIEVSESSGSGWSDLVANTRSSGRSYAHTGLNAGVTRYYRVFAINRAGEGRSSPVVSGQTQATGAKPKRPGVMYLYFTASDRDRNESPEATSDGNRIEGDCSGQKYFRAYWTEPNSPPVNEWEVRVESSNGASASGIQVRYRDDSPDYPEFAGRALFATAAGESSYITFAVRGRYGNTWGEWGPTSTLSCKNDE